MNAFVRKEVRLLLPNWTIAFLSAFTVWLLPVDLEFRTTTAGLTAALPFFLCPSMVVVLALDAFGRELGYGTFSSLLAQPISRARIWRTKVLLLAVAVALVYGVWSFSCYAHLTKVSAVWKPVAMFGVFVLVACSGGLWTVLLVRQVGAACWFTLLIPMALLVALGVINSGESHLPPWVILVVLLAYSVAGFFWARWLFLRAQDTRWAGGNIALPKRWTIPRLNLRWAVKGTKRPWVALLAKELQLHQSLLLLAGALLVLHGGVITVRTLGEDLRYRPVMGLFLSEFWMLWLVLPLLVGSAAVAEERRLGTLAGQLCLPVKRSTQFVVKYGVVLLLSSMLGAVMPIVLDGSRVFPRLGFNAYPLEAPPQTILLNSLSAWAPFLTLICLSASIATLSFYASSFTRHMLQTLAPASLGIFCLFVISIFAPQPEVLLGFAPWRGLLVFLIVIPLGAITLVRLMAWNSQQVQLGWNVWRRNLLTLLAALALGVGLTAALYQRVWELFSPIEPRHGVARLTRTQPVIIHSHWSSLLIQVPNGQAWARSFQISAPNWFATLTKDYEYAARPDANTILEGTNWTSVAFCGWDVVGIQSDGSLWVPETPWKPPYQSGPPATASQAARSRLVKFGAPTDWKSVFEVSPQSVFLLKQDGTLWCLGTNQWQSRKPWPGLRAYEPERWGDDSDWMEVFKTHEGRLCFRKRDGRVWAYKVSAKSQNEEPIRLTSTTFLERAPYLDQRHWRSSTVWYFPAHAGECEVGVSQSGTLVVAPAWSAWRNASTQQGLAEKNHQLGIESNWVAVASAANDDAFVALKSDGSLWKWSFTTDPIAKSDSASTTRLGTHSDWVGLTRALGGVVSLAADGNLWLWRFEPKHPVVSSPFELRPLWPVSRRPVPIANIFDSAN